MTDLFNEFKASSANQWKAEIINDLKGRSFNTLINKKGILPFYHADNTLQNSAILKENNWHTCQLIDATDAVKANRQAILALENEVSALCFSNPNNLKLLLKNIAIENIRIDFKNYSATFVTEWITFIKNKQVYGAFHNEEDFSHPTYSSTIIANGKSTRNVKIYI